MKKKQASQVKDEKSLTTKKYTKDISDIQPTDIIDPEIVIPENILKKLDKKEVATIERIIAVKSYQGPIPHSEEFAQYELALPGAGDRILGMAEGNQETRTELAKKELDILSNSSENSHSLAKSGQNWGGVIALAFLGGGIYVIEKGFSIAGLLIIGFVVIVVIGFALSQKFNMKMGKMKFDNNN